MGPKEMQTLDLLNKDFKTTTLKMLTELNQNMGKELKEIKKMAYEQNKNINEIKITFEKEPNKYWN